VLRQTIGTAIESTRAGLNCNFWEHPFIPIPGFSNAPGSAHCLIYQSEWCACSPHMCATAVCGALHSVASAACLAAQLHEHVYVHSPQVLPYRWEVYTPYESTIAFTITITINATNATTDASAPTVSAVTLTPSTPKVVSPDKRVSAQLVGDLVPYRAYPVLTSQRLVMPALSNLNQLRPADWMLVDPSMITLDGTECNKIGVGFTAFRCAPAATTCTQAANDMRWPAPLFLRFAVVGFVVARRQFAQPSVQ
jgi:Male gamete fusion factor